MSRISSHIRIEDFKVWKNGELILDYSETKELNKFLKAIYKLLGMKYMKFFKMDSLSKMGLIGAELLLDQNSLMEKYKAEEIAVVLANASASLDVDRKYYNTIKDAENYFPSPALFVYTLPNIVLGEICIRHGFKGENAFFIQKELDSDFIYDYNEDLLLQKDQNAIISGWVEVNADSYKAVMYLIEKEEGDIKHLPNNIKSLFLTQN
jgi:hypothetical protein